MHAAISAARTIADHIKAADPGPRLDRVVSEFSEVLRSIPTHGVAAFTPPDHDAIKVLAELVIDRIEDHLAASHERSSIQQALAAAIYRIRQELEDIDRWQRHFHPTSGPASGRAS